MARGFTIRESDIFNEIVKEFNDTAMSSKIKFSLGDWNVTGVDDEGNAKGLLINKFSFNSQGKFDVVESFDENTYIKSSNSFVAMSISSLNGEFIALETIKEVYYSPIIEFLVCIDNVAVHTAITYAIEEVRKRFIQYFKKINVYYTDLDNPSNDTQLTEALKLIFVAGTIDFGTIVQIAGKQYLTYSMPVSISATNFGLYTNEQRIYLGVDSILENDSPKMFLLEPNEWHYGMAAGIESTQLLPQYSEPTYKNAKEGKSVQKNKVWTFQMDQQIDIEDENIGPILRHLYKRSIQEELTQDIYTLKIETYVFFEDENDIESSTETYWDNQIESNRGTFLGDVSEVNVNDYPADFALRLTDGTLPANYTYYKIILIEGGYRSDDDLLSIRKMIATANQPNDTLSKGEKIVNTVILVPYFVSTE